MARRRNNPNPVVDWSKWDQDYTFEHKDANMEMLQASDPYWIDIFESQDKGVQDAILRGEVSLLELEDSRQELSDVDYTAQYDTIPEVSAETPIEGETPEEAALRLESEPIDSRLGAIASQFGGHSKTSEASADFQDLDSLLMFETEEQREEARTRLKRKLSDPRVQMDISGAARNGILMELHKIDAAERIFNTPGLFDKELQRIAALRGEGQAQSQAAEAYYDRTGNIGARTVGDVASSWKSGLSIVGGVAGGIAGAAPGAAVGAGIGSIPITKEAYDIAYTEARFGGASRSEAEEFATFMSGSEFVFEAIGGKVGAGGLKAVAKDQLKKWFAERAGKTSTKIALGAAVGATTGYAEEAATEALQTLGAAGWSELVENGEFKNFLRDQAPRNEDGSIDIPGTLAQVNRAGLAGAAMGGPVVATGAGVKSVVENAARTQEAILNNTIHNEEAKTRFQAAIDQANDLTNTMARDAGIEGVIKTHNELLGEPSEQRPQVEPYLNTSPLADINTQYQGAGGSLSTGTDTSLTSPRPLTAAQRGARLKGTIQASLGPTIAQEAPSGPATALSDRTATPVAQTTPVASTTPTVAPKAPKVKGAKKTKKAPKTPNQEALLAKIEGLKSTPESRKADVKPAGRTARARDIIANLVRSGSADTDSLVDLVNKGRLGIVDTEADLPDGVEMGRDGWYDPKAKRVYLVADRLKPETVRGTALHEVNHFLNRNKKDPKTKTGITNLISGNLDSYNTRITRLAESGNKIAKAALERAKADGNVREELTSYFASEALDAISKKGVLGQAGQIFRDIKSAINTTARNKGIADLSDNDISYILRRQVEDADSVDFTDDGKGLTGGAASIIGERSPDFQDTIKKFPKRPYRGALDNRWRVEISDRLAELVRFTEDHVKLLKDKGLSIRNILKHDDLFKAYPDKMTTRAKVPTRSGSEMDWEFEFGPLGHINVTIDESLSDGAAYSIEKDSIAIAPSAVTSPNLKGYLLHELQHAIQARENFANGANLMTIYKRLLKEAERARGGETIGMFTPEDYAIRQEAWAQYDATYGEAEARLSENNFALTDQELSENLPETRMTVRALNSPRPGEPGTIKTSKAQATKLRPGSRPLMRVELPEGLASIKPTRGGEFSNFWVRGLRNDMLTSNPQQYLHPTYFDHIDRMLKNYLSRWAGTENDPLKNVTHPLLGQNLNWEDAWDGALTPILAKTYRDYLKKFEDAGYNMESADMRRHAIPEQVPDNTPIWGGQYAKNVLMDEMERDMDQTDPVNFSTLNLGEYLGHVAEFLATKPDEELKNYDLIRAVRESQQYDTEAKKKAEKQRAITDSKLRTYIQFPDGYRWVRLDSPGQFAAESDMMGHSVRGYEPSKLEPMLSPIQWFERLPAYERQQILDVRDKASVYEFISKYPRYIKYVEAYNVEPEVQAEMDAAGEGGHSNYGYGGWQAIKKDQARIYSLRDPKGKSVVTVELGREISDSDEFDADRAFGAKDKFEVSQIKGAYNNAPNKSLHPKIQDLLLNLNDEGLIDTALDIGDAVEGAGLVHDNVFGGESYHAATSETGQLINDYFADPDKTISSTMMRAFEKTSTDTAFFSQPPTTKRVAPNVAAPQGLASISPREHLDNLWTTLKNTPEPTNSPITSQDFDIRDAWITAENKIGEALRSGALSTYEDALITQANPKSEAMRAWAETTVPKRKERVDKIVREAEEALNNYLQLTGNKPPTGLASTSKYSKKDVSVWDDTAGSIIKMLFLPNKGIGEEAFNTREYWRLKSAGLRDKAEGVAVRINYALKKDNHDPKVFEEAVLKAEAQKTPIERERALDALVRNYGNAAREYREGRMLVDQLSKEIVKDWYNEVKKTGRKASKSEIATMNAIVENIGKYTHRVYLSDLPKTGTNYAKSIMSLYDKGDPNNPYFQKVQAAVDYLLEHEVGIAPREELLKKKTDTIRRTYQTWIGPGDNLTKFEMIDALDAKRAEVGPKEMDTMVRKVVREMLGLDDPTSTNPISRFYRAGALDEGILQHRERVPKVLRELLGEVTDPGQRILTTVSAQADLLFKNRMLTDYYDNGEGILWVRPGDRAKPGNEKFTERLTTDAYGPLEGMYVTKNFAFAIRSQRTQIMELKDALIMAGLDGTKPVEWAGGKIAKGVGALSTVQKLSKTAFDIGAWGLNGFGSWWSLLKNGQLIGTTKASREALRDAVILALQGFGYEHKIDKATNERLSVLLEHGIPDSIFTAELRDSEKEFFNRLLEELNKESLTNTRKAWAAAKHGVRGIRDTYGLLDSWVKVADFYGQQKYLTAYHKANGDNLTEEQINRKAADTVKKRNITYSRAPIAVQTLERSGLTVFATFASEVIRTTLTTPGTIVDALEMAENAKTPEAKNIALMEATRIGVGYTTAMAIMPGFLHVLLTSLWNGEDDDEEAKAEREAFLKLWFETDRDQSFVVLGKNEDGGIVLFNAARIDPNGHTTDFVRAAAQNDDPKEYWESVKGLFTNAAGNGYADDVMNMLQGKGAKDSMLADTFPAAQKELQDLFEWAGSTRDAADRVTRVIDNFVPTTALRLMPDYSKKEGLTMGEQNSKYVVTEAASQQDLAIAQVLAASGMRLTVVDPVKVAGFEVNTFNVERARNVTAWNRLMERDGITHDDVARTALNIYTSEIETARRMAEVYSGLNTELAGVNPRKVLKEANLNAEDINDAALARYRSEVLSPSRLRESEKRQLSKVTDPEARRTIRENYRLAREALAELQLETR